MNIFHFSYIFILCYQEGDHTLCSVNTHRLLFCKSCPCLLLRTSSKSQSSFLYIRTVSTATIDGEFFVLSKQGSTRVYRCEANRLTAGIAVTFHSNALKNRDYSTGK